MTGRLYKKAKSYLIDEESEIRIEALFIDSVASKFLSTVKLSNCDAFSMKGSRISKSFFQA